MKKIMSFILVMIITISTILPIAVYANNDTFEMQKMTENKYEKGASWVKYYYPSGYDGIYKNVVVLYESNGNSSRTPEEATKFFIIYYSDTCKITAGSGTGFSENVLMIETTTIEEVENILFENPDGTYDFQVTTAGPGWSCTWIYTEDDFKGYKNHASTSIENYYYNYYYEQNGFYPVTTNINVQYICDGEIIQSSSQQVIAGEIVTLNKIIMSPSDYNILSINVNGNYSELTDEYMITKDTDITVLIEKNESANAAGIIATLKQILSTLQSYLSFDYISALGDVFPQAKQIISEKLADNEFYTSTTAIMVTLKELFNEDYSDGQGFYDLGLFNITLGTPEKVYYKNYGNEVIGDWEKVERVEKLEVFGTEVNFGLDNQRVLNLDWYFGEKFDDGTYTKGMKPTIDAFISAWMWVTFALWLWKTMPDWISGDMSSVGSLAVNDYTATIKEQERIEREEYNKSYEKYEKDRKQREEYKDKFDRKNKKKVRIMYNAKYKK